MDKSLDKIPVAVRAIVGNYSRRAAWLDIMEIKQEAALVMIEAARTWRPGGVPLAQYQAACVAKRLCRLSAESSSPVRPFVGAAHTRVWAVGCSTAALEEMPDGSHGLDMESRIDMERAAREVRDIVSRYPEAHAVLIEERRPAEVAAESGLPVTDVYRQTKRAKLALRASAGLQAIWGGP